MRNKIIKAAVLLMIPFAAFIISNNTYAEGEGVLVYIGKDFQNPCRITDYAGSSSFDVCTDTFAEFNATTNELTLKDPLNTASSINLEINKQSPISIKIKSDVDISIKKFSIKITGSVTHSAVFDIGTNRLSSSIDVFDIDKNEYESKLLNLTIKSGLVTNTTNLGANTFSMENGEFEVGDFTIYGAVNMDGGKLKSTGRIYANYPDGKATINNGQIEASNYIEFRDLEMKNGLIKTNHMALIGDSVVKGGTITVVMMEGAGYVSSNSAITSNGGRSDTFTLEGGTVIVRKDEGVTRAETIGIILPKFIIKDGSVIVDGFDYGISCGPTQFLGGEAIIKNSREYSLVASNDFETVLFGQDMGIKEKGIELLSEVYEGYGTQYKIPAADIVTITRLTGDDPSGDSEDSDESDIKVPDTSTINSKEGSALAIFAMSTAVILAIIGFGSYIKNRNKDHYTFDK